MHYFKDTKKEIMMKKKCLTKNNKIHEKDIS